MSKRKIELFNEVLGHFDYHTYWGLNYHEIVPANNLATGIVDLINDEELQSSFRHKLIVILRDAHFIVTFIFWLFNIDNFRVNIYLWAACIAHNEFVLPKEDRPIHFDLARSGWDLGAIQWFRTELNKKVSIEGNSLTNIATHNDLNIQFTVNRYMQPYLNTLKINRENGEFLSWEEIRKAFKKQALLVHPDKCVNKQQANETFNELKEALNYFELNMQTKENSVDQRLDYIRMGINKLIQRLDETGRLWDETKRTLDETKRTLDETNKTLDAIELGIGELNFRIDRLERTKAEREKQTIPINTDIVININNTNDCAFAERADYKSSSTEKKRSFPSSDTSNEMTSLLVSKGLYAIKTSSNLPSSTDTQENSNFECI